MNNANQLASAGLLPHPCLCGNGKTPKKTGRHLLGVLPVFFTKARDPKPVYFDFMRLSATYSSHDLS